MLVNKMDNKDTLDIFICAHKNFEQQVFNPCYKIITDTKCQIDTTLDVIREEETEITPREFSYAEGSAIYYIWKKCKLKKYIGLCHYRTYFQFMDDIPNMDELFSKYDIVTLDYDYEDPSIIEQYKNCHIGETIDIIIDIISKKYPELEFPFIEYLNQPFMYIRNMFIMKCEDFNKYCEFVFNIMFEFDKQNNIISTEDVKKIISPYILNTQPYNYDNAILCQSRLEGYILERLTSFYIMHYFDRDKIKIFKRIDTAHSPWY